MASVAVAVKGDSVRGGKGSRRAVRWAVENLMPVAGRLVLVHVMPAVTSIPTPSGDHIPRTELDTNVVATYIQDVKLKYEAFLIPYKEICKSKNVETLVLEDENPAAALLRYVSESDIRALVLGDCSSNFIVRKLKGRGIPTTILRCAPEYSDVYVIARGRIIKKSATISSIRENSSMLWTFAQRDFPGNSGRVNNQISGLYAPSTEAEVHKAFNSLSISDLSYPDARVCKSTGYLTSASVDQERNDRHFRDYTENFVFKQCKSVDSKKTEQSEAQDEVEQLRQELHNTVIMYERACEELVHAENKVQLFSSKCLEEAGRVNDALEREETLRTIAAKQKAKHLQAMKEVKKAKDLLAREVYERQMAELSALKGSLEKQRMFDTLFSNDRRYRRYNRDEIEQATNFFSEGNAIGEGGYGKVYKCSLDCTPVAIKVLGSDAVDKREEFLKEVEVLSQLHHPHIVLLLGACPENSCLVYEYLENGSLEEYISHQNGKAPLPWFIRFRIIFEVACALAFLHNSKPEPVVHRDLKPGNILLDRNYVSKIGDVGLAKFISNVVPDNVTEYRDSIIAGTLNYMDPEYQRTGTIRPKSDLYAFGIIALQLLTASRPNGLILTVENAITNRSFADILDKSITDWPLAESEELAQIALECSKLRCRDRPELDTQVLPVLEKLACLADSTVKLGHNNVFHAPSHYFCPILQEIMDDPYIAADGFTYENRAIKAWLEKHNVSPVTKLRLRHSMLTPNHTLRSVIQEWKSRMA